VYAPNARLRAQAVAEPKARITSSEAIRRILAAVGLATDAPPLAPPRSAEDLFGLVTA
jgi:hypothetical protein